MSQKVPVTGELRFEDFGSLHAASTAELLDELARRSVGCLVVALRTEETAGKNGKAHADRWHYRIKGSDLLLGAMFAGLALEIDYASRPRGDDGLAAATKR